MKKRNQVIALGCALITTIGMVPGVAFAEDGDVYTAEYDITADYMEENEDTGELSLTEVPSTPMDEENEQAKSAACGYAEGFGSFVDAVSVTATLTVDGDTYTYTIKDQCGTEENGMGYYAPEFTWTGTVVSADDTSIEVEAPTAATITIYSEGQFATNTEMTGYFGENEYTADETTTDCPYTNIPAGENLLTMFVAGTFSVDGETLGEFTPSAAAEAETEAVTE